MLKDELQGNVVPMVTHPKNMETNSITLSLDFCPMLPLISILCLSVSLGPPALCLVLGDRGDLEQTHRKEVVASKCHGFRFLMKESGETTHSPICRILAACACV